MNSSSLNTCRSAVSLICNNFFKNCSIVSRFSKGAYDLRPAKPKYDHIDSLDRIIYHLEEMWPLTELDLSSLTLKLVMLMELVTAHRRQTLASSNRSNIIENSNGYEIRMTDKIKTSGPSFCQPLLILSKFSANPNICVASTLKDYIKVMSHLIADSDCLFITTIKPHEKASKDTISRWLRSVLKNCGIGRNYALRIIRHASTSTAL